MFDSIEEAVEVLGAGRVLEMLEAQAIHVWFKGQVQELKEVDVEKIKEYWANFYESK